MNLNCFVQLDSLFFREYVLFHRIYGNASIVSRLFCFLFLFTSLVLFCAWLWRDEVFFMYFSFHDICSTSLFSRVEFLFCFGVTLSFHLCVCLFVDSSTYFQFDKFNILSIHYIYAVNANARTTIPQFPQCVALFFHFGALKCNNITIYNATQYLLFDDFSLVQFNSIQFVFVFIMFSSKNCSKIVIFDRNRSRRAF